MTANSMRTDRALSTRKGALPGLQPTVCHRLLPPKEASPRLLPPNLWRVRIGTGEEREFPERPARIGNEGRSGWEGEPPGEP